MTVIADPVAGLVEFLKADAPDVEDLTSGRVFGGQLPKSENPAEPRACVVLRPAGGAGQFGGGYQQFSDQRIDAFCYGPTPHDAYQLWMTVHVALKQLERTVRAKTLIHWCRPTGGPLSLRDSSTEWPYTFASFQVLASEIPLA
jgi:hypothetical protein